MCFMARLSKMSHSWQALFCFFYLGHMLLASWGVPYVSIPEGQERRSGQRLLEGLPPILLLARDLLACWIFVSLIMKKT